jgi:hypothetical protein
VTRPARIALRTRAAWLLAPVAIVFLVQPLLVYVGSYERRDCDDKAVHFFTAMYFRAPEADREAFRAAIEPFVRNNEADPKFLRTSFRLQVPINYPLANLAISFFHGPDRHYADSVKWGLFTVATIALLIIVWIGSRTPFGFWQTVLVLNLIAFHTIPADFLIGSVPARQHPFITYVPRGTGSVMIVATVLAFAARRWVVCALSVLLVFLWHAALGLVNAAVVMTAAGLFAVVDRYRPSRLWADEFYQRALALALLALCVAGVLSKVVAVPRVGGVLQTVTGVSLVTTIPLRLTGMRYCLVVLVAVLGARLLYCCARQRLRPRLDRSAPELTAVAVAVLFAIGLTHSALYTQVLKQEGAFFQPQCQQTTVVALPENQSALSASDQATVFRSFGDYLFRLRQSAHPTRTSSTAAPPTSR